MKIALVQIGWREFVRLARAGRIARVKDRRGRVVGYRLKGRRSPAR